MREWQLVLAQSSNLVQLSTMKTILAALTLLFVSVSARITTEGIPDLATAANNSLFDKWRPRFHFLGPNSWQNDPCAAVPSYFIIREG
jgi:beta-fructofuranosidase